MSKPNDIPSSGIDESPNYGKDSDLRIGSVAINENVILILGRIKSNETFKSSPMDCFLISVLIERMSILDTDVNFNNEAIVKNIWSSGLHNGQFELFMHLLNKYGNVFKIKKEDFEEVQKIQALISGFNIGLEIRISQLPDEDGNYNVIFYKSDGIEKKIEEYNSRTG